MRPAVIVIISTLLATACGGAQSGGTPHMPEISGDGVGVWVQAEGESLPIFIMDGRYYLLGKQGRRYTIGLANRTDARVEIVVSVDGRDVISGRMADYRSDRGYVILPGEQISVEGFRQSLDQVAAFEFVVPEESYAARMGDGDNVGVIGIAVFEEESTPQQQVIADSQKAKAGPDVPAMSRSEDEEREADRGLGTKYGQSLGSSAEIVPFKRRYPRKPTELLAIYYNDREGLEGIGIVFTEDSPPLEENDGPNPFPGVQTESGFAPPPPGN